MYIPEKSLFNEFREYCQTERGVTESDPCSDCMIVHQYVPYYEADPAAIGVEFDCPNLLTGINQRNPNPYRETITRLNINIIV